jgi:hypothetical protein
VLPCRVGDQGERVSGQDHIRPPPARRTQRCSRCPTAYARSSLPLSGTAERQRSLGAISTLNYPRHFFLLGCGSMALVLLTPLPISLVYDRLYFLFGLSGALHAIAVVLALRSKPSRLSRFGFVVAAAALSIAAPLAALQLIELLGLRGIATIFVALALIAAIGAVSY